MSGANEGLRAITRDVVRQQLSNVAVDLFAEHGFDRVTVDQVAAAAGLSVRSVHRYFPAKEDMVVGPLAAYGDHVRAALEQRPSEETVLVSLHEAFAEMLRTRPQTQRDKIAIRLFATSSALEARHAEKHLAWAKLLEPLVAQRLAGSDNGSLRARVLVYAGLSAFSTALSAWADENETRSLHELLRIAFDTLRST